jgi:hypothetical protein
VVLLQENRRCWCDRNAPQTTTQRLDDTLNESLHTGNNSKMGTQNTLSTGTAHVTNNPLGHYVFHHRCGFRLTANRFQCVCLYKQSPGLRGRTSFGCVSHSCPCGTQQEPGKQFSKFLTDTHG